MFDPIVSFHLHSHLHSRFWQCYFLGSYVIPYGNVVVGDTLGLVVDI